MAQVALGSDAVILQTRRVQGSGLMGLFTRPRVEVLAALDVNRPSAHPLPAAGLPNHGARARAPHGIGDQLSTARDGPIAHAAPQPDWHSELAMLRREMASLRSQLQATAAAGDVLGTKGGALNAPDPLAAPPSTVQSPSGRIQAPRFAAVPPLRPYSHGGARDEATGHRPEGGPARCLGPGGIPTGHPAGAAGAPADAVGAMPEEHSEAVPRHSPQATPPPPQPEGLSSRAVEEMARRLLSGLVTRPIEFRDGACTAVALVGPTGVGKTTTLAKLAAVASHVERKRVAFITVDTYRIGAVEQLETYARLLDLPLCVAYAADDVRAGRERFADFDLVLIDTVGCSPMNTRQVEELAVLLEAAAPDETHLALDARGSYATHHVVLRGFRIVRPTQILLSKLDESPRLEDSLAAAFEGELPLSYITTGQRVPEDLAPADSEQLTAWLLGG